MKTLYYCPWFPDCGVEFSAAKELAKACDGQYFCGTVGHRFAPIKLIPGFVFQTKDCAKNYEERLKLCGTQF